MRTASYTPAAIDTVGVARDLQDRIARLARAIFLVALAMGLSFVVIHALTGSELKQGPKTTAHETLHLIALAVPLVAWWRLRGGQLERWTLDAVDAALPIVMSILFAGMGFTASTMVPVELTGLMSFTYTIVGRSIMVPSPYRRTLWISSVAAIPTITYFALHEASGPGPVYAPLFSWFGVSWCVIGVIAATANSRQLFGLRAELREVKKLGQYTLEEKIGEGGMGAVYRASHAMLRRPAAIKLLLPERAGEKDLARFEKEVQLTTRLSHPSTISIFDYGRTPDGVFYYVMEYLDGLDLERFVRQTGPVEAPRAIHLLAQAAGALAEAHALGLIHRDIKPANIVVTARVDEPDVVKVVDFGLVKSIEQGDGAESVANVVTGTPQYLAPEAISAPDAVDARADLYALGAVAYFLVTGEHVFEGGTVIELCSRHLVEAPVPPSQRLGRPVPDDLERLILACLAKDRAARPGSATALRDALLGCADARRYDRAAATAWWQARRVTPATPVSSSASMMAVDLRRRTS